MCISLQSVEGLKVVLHELAQVTNYPEGSTMDDIVKDANQLVSILANKVHIRLHCSFSGPKFLFAR